MLDEYCNSLSDKAQLKIALRLGKIALPVWENYFTNNPDVMDAVNDLIKEDNRIKGGAAKIDIELPRRALEKIEGSLKNSDSPKVPSMKSDALLQPLLATMMQPLTNPQWDDILPYSIKLVFTMVWNILTWILMRRKTDADETHIYIAINQGADILMSEKIYGTPEIEELLIEYKDQARQKHEDELWSQADGIPKDNNLNTDEIYRKISGENIIKDACGIELAKEILRQMREQGKSFWDEWEEYYSGTCKTYSYNKEQKSYWCTEADVVAASFFEEYPLSEEAMLEFIADKSKSDLRGDGFEI